MDFKSLQYVEEFCCFIFIELKQQSNGDAYDRTGSIFFIPENKSQTFFDGMEKGVKKKV